MLPVLTVRRRGAVSAPPGWESWSQLPGRLGTTGILRGYSTAPPVYVAFVVDVFSRRIVGWRVPSSLRSDRALDARLGAPGVELDAGLQGLGATRTPRNAIAASTRAIGITVERTSR